MSNDPSILIIAAEASSTLYAQRLLEHWQKSNQNVKAFGVGSQAMVDIGFEAFGRSEEMAVVGLTEVIGHFRQIRRVFFELLGACEKYKPKVALLLDYPGFNLRIAPRLKKLGIPVVYYISPQLWAWKSSRIKTVQASVDQMLVVFPFEVDFYKKHNVAVEFVGHPLIDEWERVRWTPEQRRMHRRRFGISDENQLVGLMPGSRYSELKYNLREQLMAARTLSHKRGDTKFAWLVAPTFDLDEARQRLGEESALPVQLIRSDPFTMIQLCDAMMVASGTATLMVGLAKVPMVIMYKMNSFTAFMAKRLVKGVSHFGMVNLISGHEVVPELFQEQASAHQLAETTEHLLETDVRMRIQNELEQLPHLLGGGNATKNVAGVLNQYLGN